MIYEDAIRPTFDGTDILLKFSDADLDKTKDVLRTVKNKYRLYIDDQMRLLRHTEDEKDRRRIHKRLNVLSDDASKCQDVVNILNWYATERKRTKPICTED